MITKTYRSRRRNNSIQPTASRVAHASRKPFSQHTIATTDQKNLSRLIKMNMYMFFYLETIHSRQNRLTSVQRRRNVLVKWLYYSTGFGQRFAYHEKNTFPCFFKTPVFLLTNMKFNICRFCQFAITKKHFYHEKFDANFNRVFRLVEFHRFPRTKTPRKQKLANSGLSFLQPYE